MIAFPCACCQQQFAIKDELAGTEITCPGCGKVVAVPLAAAILASPEEARRLPPRVSSGTEEGMQLPPTRGQAWEESLADASERTGSGAGRHAEAAQSSPAQGPSREFYDFLAPAQQSDEIGRLGPFRVLQVLGAGGMGIVYKAEDPQLKRPVALKAMRPALAASASARQRFLREAKAAAALDHDHIVPILQVGEDRGVPFLAMQLLEGESLHERLKRQPRLAIAEVLRIGRETAEGLAAAHQVGLIHRDIKPANLWLEVVSYRDVSCSKTKYIGEDELPLTARPSPLSRVKILDFGLARGAGDDDQLTQSGAIIGTPAYMAPEQAAGEKVDQRCDLFSLGCVLYSVCTGSLPFTGQDRISTLVAVATHNPPPPAAICPAVPPELSDLVMHLLAKKPEGRPEAAHVVAAALMEIEKTEAARTPPGQSATKRLPLPWLVGGSVFGFAVLAILLFFLLRPGDNAATREQPQTTGSGWPPSTAVRSSKPEPPPPTKPETEPQTQPEPSPEEGFAGEWVNVNKDTRGLKRLVISKKSDAWSIEAWGTGGGGEIPWKKVDLSLLGENASAKSRPYGFATWDHGFAVQHLTLRAEKAELVVQRYTIFKDKSGRSNFHVVEKFKKKDPGAQPGALPPRFTNSLGMEFALVPKGKSWLGGGGGKPGTREVVIPDDFYLGLYEVTQEEWQIVMGNNPSHFSRTGPGKLMVKPISDADLKRLPVESVTLEDAELFATRLNERDQQAGWRYRLPTPVEWEYACRGGPLADQVESAFDFYFALPTNQVLPGQANFGKAGQERMTCKVGSYQPNRLGLYDMHGNVCEWCPDRKLGSQWFPGGSFLSLAEGCRASVRPSGSSHRSLARGLRLARVPVKLDK